MPPLNEQVESIAVSDETPPATNKPGRGAQTKVAKIAQRATTSAPVRIYKRLNAVDFMNSAFNFSVLLVVCFFPVLVIFADVTGKSIQNGVITRLGLNPQAAKDVEGLIGSGRGAMASLTIIGAAFLVLCAIGIASTLQGWYQRVFEVVPPDGWKKPLINRAAWCIGVLAYLYVQVLIGEQTGPAGGRLLIFVCEFVVSLFFWWWSLHVLLYGRMGWRALFPAGLTTAICSTGLSVFSALLFSNSIISDENSYGPIGVMMVLLSYCIGVGVVLHIGAVVGRMWNERHTPAEVAT
jgi:membrane protein